MYSHAKKETETPERTVWQSYRINSDRRRASAGAAPVSGGLFQVQEHSVHEMEPPRMRQQQPNLRQRLWNSAADVRESMEVSLVREVRSVPACQWAFCTVSDVVCVWKKCWLLCMCAACLILSLGQ